MPARFALNVSLTPELLALIADKAASGRYASASEVVRHALRLLEGEPPPAGKPRPTARPNGSGAQAAPAQAADLMTILDGIGEGFYAVDRDWRITLFNNESARYFGRAAKDMVDRVLWEVFPGARETELGRQFVATMAKRRRVKSEAGSVLIPGRWLAYRLFPLGDGMGIVFRDITDRKSAEEHRDLLTNELNHRVKNTLATVQAMAAQTLRNAGVNPRVQRTFAARLLALSNVHDVLTEQSWESAELSEVIRAALQPHAAPGRENFRLAGPRLRLRPKSAVAVSMALHELSTNAAKYGALSAESGHVALRWEVSGERFRLRWQEHGGPPVAPPRRKGFGSRLIERGLAAEFRGQVKIAYEREGVVCTIDAPVEAVRDDHVAA
jgi:PAS domain S-box-containing protein